MAVYLILAFGLFGLVAFSVLHYSKRNEKPFNYTPEYNHDLNDNEVELLRLINQHRINLGLVVVQPEVLASEVCLKAIESDIANNRPHSHIGWELRAKACKSNITGEICNSNLHSALGFFTEYVKSRRHRECIENESYTHIGISLFEKRNYCIFTKY